MIQIEEPRIEALIQQRLSQGGFSSVEDVLEQALTDAPLPVRPAPEARTGTGADLIAAFQHSPFLGLDLDLDSYRGPMPVSDPVEF